jgi:hypothetical protein
MARLPGLKLNRSLYTWDQSQKWILALRSFDEGTAGSGEERAKALAQVICARDSQPLHLRL